MNNVVGVPTVKQAITDLVPGYHSDWSVHAYEHPILA